jgi:DNA-binding SARP family transcriptional activator
MLKFNMLGGLSVELDGSLLRINLGQPGFLFTCYIVQFKGLHRSDHLIELFWPQLPAEKGRAALNNATWRLRRLLQLDRNVGADKLFRLGDDLVLEPCDQIRADTHDLLWAANRVMQHEKGNAPGADEEVAITNSVLNYRGPFLEGMDAPWILPERAHLHELCARVQNYLIRLSVSRGDYESALLQSRRMAAVDPLNERVHGDLMLLLLRIGRQAEAVRCYERLEEMLRAELGIKPMPETQRLVSLIKTGDVFSQIDDLLATHFRHTPSGPPGLITAA